MTLAVERIPPIALTVAPDQPLDTLPPGMPDTHGIRTLGWGVLSWALRVPFHQPNGPRAGQSFKPTLRQVRFILWWYAVDDHGDFIFRHGVRRLAKGSGKSPFAAFLSLCELCGPVRFERFDDDAPGGAVGKIVYMPLIQICATSESQTKNTMRMVREFGSKKSSLAKTYGLDPGKTVFYHPQVGGELVVITSSSTGQEGAEPSMIVADETEHWLPNNGGDDLVETLDRNLAKSGSRMLETCNSWEPGAGSVAEATWDAFVMQEEGKLRGETRILYDCLEAPAVVELTDEAALISALTIVYEDCSWVRVRDIAERIWSPKTRPAVARRFYLNQRVSDETSWTTPTAWAALADPSHVVADQTEIAMFFDGSLSGDSTALIGCAIESGHVFEIGVWEPKDGEEVDTEDVDLAVHLAKERWNVVAFFADVREWESFVKSSWPELFADDLVLHSAPQATPAQSIAWDMRGHSIHFAQAVELVEQEIIRKDFTHDGSSTVARHIANCQRRPFKQWVTVAKESPKSPRKIDAAVCVIGVRMVRRLLLASKEWQSRNKSKTGSYYTW